MVVDVVIPALNEAITLPLVLRAIPRELIRDVYVVDNGSTDATVEVALKHGATVLSEPVRGYGAACQRATAHLEQLPNPPDVVAYLDGDFADDPTELAQLLEPLASDRADLVIGSRTRGKNEPGALTLQQRAGNLLATKLIRLLYGQRYTDLGPFRAIRLTALRTIAMRDRGYGWTVEMQIKAARAGLRICEVPVCYRRRAGGQSKVSSTVRGTLGASYKILFTIFRYATTS